MKIYFGFEDCPTLDNVVLSIDKYTSYQDPQNKQLDQLIALTEKLKGISMMITFIPSPTSIPIDDPEFNSKSKLARFKESGVDHVLILPYYEVYDEVEGELQILSSISPKIQADRLLLCKSQKELEQLIQHRKRMGYNGPVIERIDLI